MTTTKASSRRRYKIYVRHLSDGLCLKAEVSPCVFMYPGYPLQLTVTLCRRGGEQFGTAYAVDRKKSATNYTDAAIRRLLAGVVIQPCKRCAAPAFDPHSISTNREGLCETCFLADLNAKWAKAAEAQRRQLAARDRRMKRSGMTVRLTAWIHPGEGDDYLLDWYFAARPTAKQVRKLLPQAGSVVLDDFEVIVL
jgi:hypothetical protein